MQRLKHVRKAYLTFERAYQQVLMKHLKGGPTDEKLLTVSIEVFNDSANINTHYAFIGDNKKYPGQ